MPRAISGMARCVGAPEVWVNGAAIARPATRQRPPAQPPPPQEAPERSDDAAHPPAAPKRDETTPLESLHRRRIGTVPRERGRSFSTHVEPTNTAPPPPPD